MRSVNLCTDFTRPLQCARKNREINKTTSGPSENDARRGGRQRRTCTSSPASWSSTPWSRPAFFRFDSFAFAADEGASRPSSPLSPLHQPLNAAPVARLLLVEVLPSSPGLYQRWSRTSRSPPRRHLALIDAYFRFLFSQKIFKERCGFQNFQL